MKRFTLCTVSLFLAIAFLSTAAFANAPNRVGQADDASRPLYSGRVLVKFRPAAIPAVSDALAQKRAGAQVGIASLDALARQAAVTSIRPLQGTPARADLDASIGLSRWHILALPAGADPIAIAARYAADPNVEAAEAEGLHYTQAIPNDPKYSIQWGHNNTGQMLDFCWFCGGHPSGSPVGTVGFDAKAQNAWDGSQGYGDASIIIAIIDSGVDTGHPDLRIWNNPGEIAGNGLDDDSNGFIDDMNGWDFANDDNNPNDTTPVLANGYGPGHGTACAGVAAGRASNALGVAGIAGGCTVMALKTISDFTTTGGLSTSAIINSIYYAADNGASVISMSFGGGPFSQATLDAITYAYGLDVVLLGSTGNSNASSIGYPSAYTNVISVGAAAPCGDRKRSSSNSGELNPGVFTDPNGYTCDNERWWGSNYGSTTQDAATAVDVLAPTILPTTDIQGAPAYDPGDYSDWFNGTSCSAPYAAGVAALIRSQNPTWTNAEVRARLVSTATDIQNVESGAGWDRYAGYGLVNAGAALAQPDLTHALETNWFDRIVPREDATADFFNVPGPVTLTGDGTSYINGSVRNFGTDTSVFASWLFHMDGVNVLGLGLGPSGVGGGGHWLNGAITVTGGRHSFTATVDATDTNTESNEANNSYGRQYVWAPQPIAPNSLVTRGAPPEVFADHDIVAASGNVAEPNSDALAFAPNTGVGYWRAFGTHAANNAENFDLYFMSPSTSVFDGLDTPSFTGVASTNGPGLFDFVLVNDNLVNTPHEIAMLNEFGGTSANHVESRFSAIPEYIAEQGATEAVPMAADQMLLVREVLSGAPGSSFRISVEVTGATQPVTLSVYDPTFTIGDQSLALASTITDPSGFGFVDVSPTISDFHGITVHRHPIEGTTPIEVTLRIRPAVTMTVSNAVPTTMSIFSAPDGSGTPVNQAWSWTGLPGDSAVLADATLAINVVASASGNPVAGIPANEIYLSGATFAACEDGASVDAPTDGAGNTMFSQAFRAGGSNATDVSIDYVPSVIVNYVLAGSWLTNSADINGDLQVNLVDVGSFASDLLAYNYRSDFHYDGAINLVDVGDLAQSLDTVCAAPAKSAPSDPDLLAATLGDDRMALSFDVAGSQAAVSLEPGRTISAYIVLTGSAAEQGIRGWEASLETSDNVRVLDWTLPPAALDLGQGNEHIVGTGHVAAATNGQPLMLATVRLQVTDDAPAQLYLRPARLRSAGIDTPAIAIADESAPASGVRVPGAEMEAPTAEINGGGAPPSAEDFVFRGVNMHNYPNPFNPATEIKFDLPNAGVANVRIFDVAGRLVKELGGTQLSTGSHALRWNGTDSRGAEVVSGTYHYRLYVDGSPMGQSGRMLLLK